MALHLAVAPGVQDAAFDGIQKDAVDGSCRGLPTRPSPDTCPRDACKLMSRNCVHCAPALCQVLLQCRERPWDTLPLLRPCGLVLWGRGRLGDRQVGEDQVVLGRKLQQGEGDRVLQLS